MQQNDKANHVVVTISEKLARLSPSSSECCILKVHNQLHEVNSKADEPDIITIIDEKFARLSPSSSECCIFKVHNQLREVNPKAYEPAIVAIGPYHRGKDNLKMMEEHKLRYLYFRLKNIENVKEYVDALRGLEAEARKCYAETLNLDTNEMIEMMLLDGFFIIELFRKFDNVSLREKNDTIFQRSWTVNSLQRDLMLFENQLPFFVLCKLFDMVEEPNNHRKLISLARCFFNDLFPGPGHDSKYSEEDQSSRKINHLLEIVHDNWPPLSEETKEKDATENERKPNIAGKATVENETKSNIEGKATTSETKPDIEGQATTENKNMCPYIECLPNIEKKEKDTTENESKPNIEGKATIENETKSNIEGKATTNETKPDIEGQATTEDENIYVRT